MFEFTYITECIAALIALVFYNKYKHLPIKYILLILWLTVIAETCARIPALRIEGTNHFIYNCFLISAYPLLYLVVFKYIKNPLRKKFVGGISILVVAILLYNAITTPFLTVFMVYMFSLTIIGLVIILLLYAVDILNNRKRIVIKSRLEMFIFTGYLLFGISYIPLTFILTGYNDLNLSEGAMDILENIQKSTVIVMNVIFVIGFIYTKPNNLIKN